MRRTSLGPITIALALLVASGAALAQKAAPQFNFSDLPPPETDTAVVPSLYEVFAMPEISPLGTPVGTVKASDLFDEASAFLRGANGHPSNSGEAAFWLKRAIVAAPDDTGKRRAWALMRLGGLLYSSGDPAGHVSARNLWEMAGAWSNAEALCHLGELAELGDDVAKPDPKKALLWYERAKKAGCAQADDALNRLKH